MLKKLIKKLVGEEIASTSSQTARLAELEAQNAALKAKLEESGPAKRLAKLKEIASKIPAGAQGMGMIAVIKDGTLQNITLKSKADLEDVIAKAEKGELEIFSA